MNGIQSLMQGAPRQPQPQQAPAMPNDPRMGAAMSVVDDNIEKFNLDPQTEALMLKNQALGLLQAADNVGKMNAPQQDTNIQEQTEQGIAGMLQRLSPGMQQRGQQMQRSQARQMLGGGAPARPPMPQQNMARPPARPAPARSPMGGMPAMGAPNMARMADGGIVGYAEGNLIVGPPEQTGPTPMQSGQQKFNHRMAMKLEKYEELKDLETKYRGENNNEGLKNVLRDLERYDGSMTEDAYNSKLRQAKVKGMVDGGIVGYAGPDGSQVQGKPTPTLGAVPPSAVGDEAIKQFAAQYTALEAGLAAATNPEDKAQSQQLMQALIRDMGNQHATVMQYLDSTKGFTTPSSQMARGGIIGFDGRDGSQVQGLTPAMQRELEKIELETQNVGAVPLTQAELMAASLARTAEKRARAAERDVRSPDNELFNIKAGLANKGYSQGEVERIISAGPQFETTNPQTGPFPPSLIGGNRTREMGGGGRGDTFNPPVGVPTSGAGSPQSDIDATLSSIAALTVPETKIEDLARSPLRGPIEEAALKNIKLDANALSEDARKTEQGLASQAYAMSPELKAAYAAAKAKEDEYYKAQLDPKRQRDQKLNALLKGFATPGGIARSGIAALEGTTGVDDAALEMERQRGVEDFARTKEQAGIEREGRVKGFEAGSRKAQAVYERTSATVNQASQSLSQLATSDETRGQAAAVQEYTRQMDGLKLQLNVFLQKEKIGQDDRRNLQRIVADMRNAQSDIDNSITDIQNSMILYDADEKAAALPLIQAAKAQKETIQQQINTTLTRLGIDVAVAPSGGGGDVIDFTDL